LLCKFSLRYHFRFYKAIAAITAAPIIPAPTLKPLPALVVVAACAEVEAAGAADEAAVVAGALDAMEAEDMEALVDMAVFTADDTLEATEAAEETADDATDAAVDAAEAALVEVPLARATEQISSVTLLVAVAETSASLVFNWAQS
jgi:hypothetical protein